MGLNCFGSIQATPWWVALKSISLSFVLCKRKFQEIWNAAGLCLIRECSRIKDRVCIFHLIVNSLFHPLLYSTWVYPHYYSAELHQPNEGENRLFRDIKNVLQKNCNVAIKCICLIKLLVKKFIAFSVLLSDRQRTFRYYAG